MSTELSGTPQETESESGTAPSPALRNRWAIASAAAIVLLIVGIAAASLVNKRSDSPRQSDTTANFAVADTNGDANSDSNAADADMNATDMNATAALQTPPEPTGWDYITAFDQVRGAAIYKASLYSENSAYFDAPYQGGSTLTMTVRKHPEYGDDVIFKISKGQFVCGVEACSGTINFGSGPQTIALSQPTDNSSDTLFLSSADTVIDQLKKAKRVIVELPFYQEGNRQFTFETKGLLIWPPPGSAPEAAPSDENEVDE